MFLDSANCRHPRSPSAAAYPNRSAYGSAGCACSARASTEQRTAIRLPVSAVVGARETLLARTVIDSCRPDTRAVIELGSGPGLNLCDVYLRGGPGQAVYAGLEPTDSGRACLARLAGLDTDFACISAAFDFNAPDYRSLDVPNGHVTVFTTHAIEQIPDIAAEVFSGLTQRVESVSGVHFEPAGWQIPGRERDPFCTPDYAARHGYNRNLIAVLGDLSASGVITITDVVPDIFSHETKNAPTLIRWVKA